VGQEIMKKVLLSILAIISLISGVYAIYAVFNGFIELVIGSVLAVASFLVLLWCLSLEKKSPLSDKTILFVLLPVLLIASVNLAYAGVEPFASGKEQILSKHQTVGEPASPISQTEKPSIESISKINAEPYIAKVESIYGGGYILNGLTASGIIVDMIPLPAALPNKVYKVDLYEKDKIRDTKTVSWNEPELNVREEKEVAFAMSQTEAAAYYGKDLSGFLTVSVHE
jgi:hypothetical protein